MKQPDPPCALTAFMSPRYLRAGYPARRILLIADTSFSFLVSDELILGLAVRYVKVYHGTRTQERGNEMGTEVETEVAPKLTPRQAAIISAYTGMLCGQFSTMHAYVEEVMGRPVWTHEMADSETVAQIKAAAKADFLALCGR